MNNSRSPMYYLIAAIVWTVIAVAALVVLFFYTTAGTFAKLCALALIAMCIEGQEMSSVALSQKMQQLAARGAPLWGDAKYGGSGEGDIALFSCALAFPHPLTGEMLTFAKKPPAAYPWMEFPGEVL